MPERTRVLITGANGFVGSAIVGRLRAEPKFAVVEAVRRVAGGGSPGKSRYVVGNIGESTDWRPALEGVDVVIHAAAKTPSLGDPGADSLEACRAVNVEGTRAMALQAAEQGVKRFVFLSSVKANGVQTEPGKRFSADDEPSPNDHYGISKLEAERALFEIGAESRMEIVVVRPPLVYGPGVKGNFASTVSWVAKGVPLPLGAINNRRSLVALDNLVDLVRVCIEHPAAVNEVFMVSDGEDVSTSDLLRRLGGAMCRPSRLIPVPLGLLEAAAVLLGKRGVAHRLLGSLQVDIGKTRDVLGWEPPVSLDEGLRRAVQPQVDGRRDSSREY